MKKENKLSIKALSLGITILIIGLLLLSGPAQAFTLNLTADKTEVGKSEKIIFTAKINLENTDQNLPVKNITLILAGPVKKQCVFDITGKAISGCFNINIKKINPTESYGYGYGYNNNTNHDFGYGYGINQNLEYEITIHSQHFTPGTYTTSLKAIIGNKTFTQSGSDIKITASSKSSETKSFSGTQQDIFFSNSNTKLELKTNQSTSGNVNIVEYSTMPAGVSGFYLPGIKFIEISTDSNIEDNMQETTIKAYYTEGDLNSAKINESTLRLYYYNVTATENPWQIYDTPNGGVNVVENYVWAKTTHFSTFGLYGNPIPTTAETGSSGSYKAYRPSLQNATLPKKLSPIVNTPETTSTDTQTLKPTPVKNQRSGITGAVVGVYDSVGGLTTLLLLLAIVITCLLVVLTFKRTPRKREVRELYY